MSRCGRRTAGGESDVRADTSIVEVPANEIGPPRPSRRASREARDAPDGTLRWDGRTRLEDGTQENAVSRADKNDGDIMAGA